MSRHPGCPNMTNPRPYTATLAGRIVRWIFVGGLAAGVAVSVGTKLAHAQTINEARAVHGLHPLRVDGRLAVIAGEQASSLARSAPGRCTLASLNHDGFAGRAAAGSIAENVSCGCTNATCAIKQWLGSAGHRANIMLRQAGAYGMASAVSRSGSTYWAMELGP